MRIFYIAGAVVSVLFVIGGVYIFMTRPDGGLPDYNRKNIVSLNYISSPVTAVGGSRGGQTRLALKLNLVVPDTTDIKDVCRHTRSILRLVKRSLSKKPIRMNTDFKADISEVRPGLLKAVRKSLGPIYVVDLDFDLKKNGTQVAFPRYAVPVVGCPR